MLDVFSKLIVCHRLLCLGCGNVLLRCEFFDSILRVFRGGNKDASAVQGAGAGAGYCFGEVPAGPAVAQSAQSSQKRSWITTDGGGGMNGSRLRSFFARIVVV